MRVRDDLPTLVDGLALHDDERALLQEIRRGGAVCLNAGEIELLADALEGLGRHRSHGLERLVRDVLDAEPHWEGSE